MQMVRSAEGILRHEDQEEKATALLSAQVFKEDRKILTRFVDPREAHNRWVLSTDSTPLERKAWQALLVARGYHPPKQRQHTRGTLGMDRAQHGSSMLPSESDASVTSTKSGISADRSLSVRRPSSAQASRRSMSGTSDPRKPRSPTQRSQLNQESGTSSPRSPTQGSQFDSRNAKTLWKKAKITAAVAKRFTTRDVTTLEGSSLALLHAFQATSISDVLAIRCVSQDWYTACCNMRSLFIGHIQGEGDCLTALLQATSTYPVHKICECIVTMVPRTELQNPTKRVSFAQTRSLSGSKIAKLFPGVSRIKATVDAVSGEAKISDPLELLPSSYSSDTALDSVRALMQKHMRLIRLELRFLLTSHSMIYLRGGTGEQLAPFLQRLSIPGITLPELRPSKNSLRGLSQSLFSNLVNLHTLDCTFLNEEKLNTAIQLLPKLKHLRCSIPVCTDLTIMSDILEHLELKFREAGEVQLQRLHVECRELRSLRLPEDDAMSSCGIGFFAEPISVTLRCSALPALVLPYLVEKMLETTVGVLALQRLQISPSSSFKNRVYRLKEADQAMLRGPDIDIQTAHEPHGRFDWRLNDIGAPIRVLTVKHVPHHWSLLVGQDSLVELRVHRVLKRTRRSDSKRYLRPPAFFMGRGLQSVTLNFLPGPDSFSGTCPNLKLLRIYTAEGPKPSECRMQEPVVLQGLPSLTSLVVSCPWDSFEITLDLPALYDLQLSIYHVIGTLTLNCPQLRTWSLQCGAGPPPVKDWKLDLDRVHTVKCELKAEANFSGEEPAPSVIKWLQIFQFLPRLNALEILMDASAEHGETPQRLRRIYQKTDFEGSEPSMREFESRTRQCLVLNVATPRDVKLFVKQRLTWGYALEKLALPSCVKLTTNALLMSDQMLHGDEIIQLPRLRDLHLVEVPTVRALDNGASFTKALLSHMPLLHLLAFEAPRDCKLGEWLPETKHIAPLADHLWQEKPHLRITVAGKDLQPTVAPKDLQQSVNQKKRSIRKQFTEPSLARNRRMVPEDEPQTLNADHGRTEFRKGAGAKTAMNLTPSKRGSGMRVAHRTSTIHRGSNCDATGMLKDRLSVLRDNDGRKRPSSADIGNRKPSVASPSRVSELLYMKGRLEDAW